MDEPLQSSVMFAAVMLKQSEPFMDRFAARMRLALRYPHRFVEVLSAVSGW
jgi:hypothetical protein